MFSATNIFDDGNSLSHKFKVAKNQFRRKAVADAGDFIKKDALFEGDQMNVIVRAAVKDKAGNNTAQGATGQSAAFVLDSQPPKVTILYPKPSAADSAVFTARIDDSYEFLGDGERTQVLKPLNFKVTEEVTEAYVIIQVPNKPTAAEPQPDTLVISSLGPDTVTDSDENEVVGYNITDTDFFTHLNPKKIPHDVTTGDRVNKKPWQDSAQGGGKVDLTVAAFDLSGNKGEGAPDGGQPTFDAKDPKIEKLFPSNAALEEDYANKIGGSDQTQNPVFRMKEEADSILVRYEGGGGILEVAGTPGQLTTVNANVKFKFLGNQGLNDGDIYDLQVYVRDLAGHVTTSDSDGDEEGQQPEIGLTFENDLTNPQAGEFGIVTEVRTVRFDDPDDDDVNYGFVFAKMDSVVAGQAMRLTISALDKELSEASGEDRLAVTYAGANVKVVAMDSDDNMVPSAEFWGGGVTPGEGGGFATLNEANWTVGERSIFMLITDDGGPYTVAVKDMTTDGLVNFMSTKEGIIVDAADFRGFEITAWEPDMETGSMVQEVWGDFELSVRPIDTYGNTSLKTYFDKKPGVKANGTQTDSLNILSLRLGKEKDNDGMKSKSKEYARVNVDFATSLVEDLPFSWSVQGAGDVFSVRTQESRTRGSVRVRAVVDNEYLDDDDSRSKNISGDETFKINQPLDVSITLWGPNGEDWTDLEALETPADGSEIMVTFLAEGFGDGDMVTFTVNGEEVEDAVEASAEGAGQSVGLSGGPGTVTVKAATSDVNSVEVSYDYAEAPAEEGRVRYVDAEGNDVYNVAGSLEVDATDIFAAIDAFGTSEGDDAYNAQADVDVDGDVDLDDLLAIAGHWGRVAVGPATKPIVLLPGINENAEFSLSLGSERVVAGELMAVDVSLANVAALMGYGFTLNYETDKFEFVSVAPADEDLLTSTGGDTPLFHHIVADGQVEVVNGMVNGTAISGGGDIVRFVFRVLREFEDNARFEIADGLVFDPSQLQNPAVVAGVLELQSTPREFALHQNFPNPFNPDTTIKYDLAESADVTLQIYNVLGQVVRTLVASEAQNAGRYQIRWSGMDDRGVSVSSGIYFYRISAGEFQNVRKLMLLK